MASLRRKIERFQSEECGATAVEYAVMIALIIGVCVAAVQTLAQSTAESFSTTANQIDGAVGGN